MLLRRFGFAPFAAKLGFAAFASAVLGALAIARCREIVMPRDAGPCREVRHGDDRADLAALPLVFLLDRRLLSIPGAAIPDLPDLLGLLHLRHVDPASLWTGLSSTAALASLAIEQGATSFAAFARRIGLVTIQPQLSTTVVSRRYFEEIAEERGAWPRRSRCASISR